MLNDATDSLIKIAEELLIAAEVEKERAEEDVVTHLICTHSRQSLSIFLTGFLLRKNIPFDHPASLETLLEQCKEVDARFDSIDLSLVNCRSQTRDMAYCLNHGQVDECIRIAKLARSIVTTPTPGY
jgi:hypothetical protein